MGKKRLFIKQVEGGCFVPTTHKLNHDGYFRRDIGNQTYVMNHRLFWEYVHGKIPEGYEIDHLCRNRACCNLAHLQCIDGSEHAAKTNRDRAARRRNKQTL